MRSAPPCNVLFFRKLLLLFLQSFGVIALEFFEILHMLRIFFFQRDIGIIRLETVIETVKKLAVSIRKEMQITTLVCVSVMLSVQTQSQLETQTNTRNSLRAQRAKIVIFRAKRGEK